MKFIRKNTYEKELNDLEEQTLKNLYSLTMTLDFNNNRDHH